MLELLNLPNLKECAVSFKAGEAVFLDGDESSDLFLLVSGRLEVLKEDKKITEIHEPGTLVGEMSYLLGGWRTASVRAMTDTLTIRIPADRIEDFLGEIPSLAPQIARILAQRLQETTRVMHGLREFCDQLPDAVIMTDRDRQILAWNQAAERLHGRTWQQMKGQPLVEVFRDPHEYRQFIEDIVAGRSLTEKILVIQHPEAGERFVSTSTTVLYDGHHNVEGYLFLSRDVTSLKNLERKYAKIRKWIIPVFCLTGLLATAFLLFYPSFSKGLKVLDNRKQSFTNRISQDARALTAALADPFAKGDKDLVIQILNNYFRNAEPAAFAITGLVVLDADKKVTHSFCPSCPEQAGAPLGASYSGLKFLGPEDNPFKRLSLFRQDPNHPMGVRGVELAYALPPAKATPEASWLLFQLDIEQLAREFGIDEEMLVIGEAID